VRPSRTAAQPLVPRSNSHLKPTRGSVTLWQVGRQHLAVVERFALGHAGVSGSTERGE
jgi:hypothetical protein